MTQPAQHSSAVRIRVEGGEGLGVALILGAAVGLALGGVLVVTWWVQGLTPSRIARAVVAVLAFSGLVVALVALELWALRGIARRAGRRARAPWPPAAPARHRVVGRWLWMAVAVALGVLSLRAFDSPTTWEYPRPPQAAERMTDR